jgi:transcriptional regulator of acetoin/glycerol metabolism
VDADRADRIRLQRSVMRVFFRYRWPHNIRELRHVLDAALTLSDGDEIRLKHIPEDLRKVLAEPPPPRHAAARARSGDSVRDRLIELYREHGGNISEVARQMGRHRVQIQRWNRRYKIDPTLFRDQ